MLESLKDLYISYPFLPVTVAPDFFRQVKDIRLVLELPAVDVLLGYKNNRNGNYIRVWLTGFATGGNTAAKALLKVQCSQISDDFIETDVPLYSWEGSLPDTQSYMLCDPALLESLPTVSEPYELNPEILVLMQTAPKLTKYGNALPETITVSNGYNVMASITNDMISLYGAVGVGEGTYEVNQPFAISVDTQAQGARSINGLYGSVTIEATFPVRADVAESILSVRWDKV